MPAESTDLTRELQAVRLALQRLQAALDDLHRGLATAQDAPARNPREHRQIRWARRRALPRSPVRSLRPPGAPMRSIRPSRTRR